MVDTKNKYNWYTGKPMAKIDKPMDLGVQHSDKLESDSQNAAWDEKCIVNTQTKFGIKTTMGMG